MTTLRRPVACPEQRSVAAAAPLPPAPVDGGAGSIAWSWKRARAAGDDALAALVDRLSEDLVLTAHDVVVLADDLASTGGVGRAGSHAALLRRLRPVHFGALDLATLVASAPGVQLCVLEAALEQLAAAGHPSRAVLLRAATSSADDGAAGHARPSCTAS